MVQNIDMPMTYDSQILGQEKIFSEYADSNVQETVIMYVNNFVQT